MEKPVTESTNLMQAPLSGQQIWHLLFGAETTEIDQVALRFIILVFQAGCFFVTIKLLLRFMRCHPKNSPAGTETQPEDDHDLGEFSYFNIINKRQPKDKEKIAACLTDQQVPDFKPMKVTVRSNEPQMDALVAEHYLAPSECKKFIDVCQTIGFTFWADPAAQGAEDEGEEIKQMQEQREATLPGEIEAKLNCENYNSQSSKSSTERKQELFRAIRSAHTIEPCLPDLAEKLWCRVKQLLPSEILVKPEEDGASAEGKPTLVDSNDINAPRVLYDDARDAQGRWVPVGLNESLLFARYTDGGHFCPHLDGSTIVDFNTRSFYTLLVYLNDVDGGGQTHMMKGDQSQVMMKDKKSGRVQGNGKNIVFSIKPVEGSCAIFRYDILHEAAAVHDGHVKYIIRGDVMFKRDPPLLDGEKDRKAYDTYQAARTAEQNGDAMAAMALFKKVRKLSPGIADVFQL